MCNLSNCDLCNNNNNNNKRNPHCFNTTLCACYHQFVIEEYRSETAKPYCTDSHYFKCPLKADCFQKAALQNKNHFPSRDKPKGP